MEVKVVESKQRYPDRLPEVWAYEMCWDKHEIPVSDVNCVPFAEEYFEEYQSIYNACFFLSDEKSFGH